MYRSVALFGNTLANMDADSDRSVMKGVALKTATDDTHKNRQIPVTPICSFSKCRAGQPSVAHRLGFCDKKLNLVMLPYMP